MIKGIGIGIGIVVGVVIALIVGAFVLGLVLRSGSTDTGEIVETVAGEWVEIARWEGNGTKNTETFTTPREWRIKWSTRGAGPIYTGTFAIWVRYPGDGGIGDLAANLIGADDDQTIIRRAGNHYLAIEATQPYVVVVEALQRN